MIPPPALTVFYQGLSAVTADNLNTFVQSGGALVADLRGFVGITGVTVTITGYTAPNDGGFGTFYWNATAINPKDDGGVSTVVPNGAAQGCWTRLVGGAISGGELLIVPTIAALRLVAVSALSSNLAVYVQGYYAPGDGGGGFFTATNSSPGSDNGGSIIALTAGSWWFTRTIDGDEDYNVIWFGAYNNGTNSLTTAAAIQNCATAAAAADNNVYAPAGTYDLRSASGAINFTCGLTGDGYDASGPIVYGHGATLEGIDTRTSGFTNGTIFMFAPTNIGFSFATNNSVIIEKLHITYPAGGNSGIAGIVVNAAAGNAGCNMSSVIRDIVFNNCNVGLKILNWLDYVIDNINCLTCTCSIIAENTNSINFTGVTTSGSAGDATITNSTFFSGQGPNHIQILSGAGTRINNNKFNYSSSNGSNQCAILISPQNIGVDFSMVPGQINDNSIEGSPVGVLFSPNSTSEGTVGLWTINDNEFFCPQCLEAVAGTEIVEWISGIIFTSNICNYGQGLTSVAAVHFDGSTSIKVSDNQFIGNNSVPTGAVSFGSNVAAFKVTGNQYGGTALPPSFLNPNTNPVNGTVYTNETGYVVLVNIYGGTVSAVNVNHYGRSDSAQVAAATNCSTILNLGDEIVVTWSGEPTWTWQASDP